MLSRFVCGGRATPNYTGSTRYAMAQVKVGWPGPPLPCCPARLFLALRTDLPLGERVSLWRMEFSGREYRLKPPALSIFLTFNMTHVQSETNEPVAHFINLSHLLTCPGPQHWLNTLLGAVIVQSRLHERGARLRTHCYNKIVVIFSPEYWSRSRWACWTCSDAPVTQDFIANAV